MATPASMSGTTLHINRAGGLPRGKARLVNMASTSLLALATMLITGSADANDAQPRVTAVAVARATIVAGVRVGTPVKDERKGEQRPLVKPRERPCPEAEQSPSCRLIVTDMP